MPPAPEPLKDRAWLTAQLKKHSPQLAVAERKVETARAALDEARYDLWPDLGVGVAYRARAAAPGDMSQGADMISATLSISLPVYAGSKQNARIRESGAELGAASAARGDVALQVATALHRAVDEAERLDRELSLYSDELLPEADEALDASVEDYQVARVGFVSVLQNWYAYLDLQLARERLTMERAQTLALIRALIGDNDSKETTP